MLALSAYFENDQIYSIVIKMRLASLRKRNKMHADREISHHKKTHFHKKRNYIGDDYLNKIVPPRRTWISPGNKRRHIELTNTQSRIKFSLLGTYVKTKRLSCNGSIEPPPWYKEFLFFCDYIRLKIKLIDSEGFESPEILAIPKKMNNDGQMEYRPLAKYNIENRIIIGLTAKYLVQALDNEFYSNSFAFRRNMPGGKAITHHTAFNKIVEYNPNAPLQITVACNPYCGPCAKAHKQLDNLLYNFTDKLKVQVRFLCPAEDENNILTIAVKAILQKAFKIKDNTELQKMLTDWFDWMEYDKWTKKWKPDSNIDIHERMKQHAYWIKQSNIAFTPTFFINGKKLPGRYSLEDFEILIRQLIELYKEEAIN